MIDENVDCWYAAANWTDLSLMARAGG